MSSGKCWTFCLNLRVLIKVLGSIEKILKMILLLLFVALLSVHLSAHFHLSIGPWEIAI